MQLRTEQLAGHLERGRLARLYVVSGDEALLCLEAQDAIREAARAQGYAEREVLHADARMDWSALDAAASGLSLFATRRLLEIRLPGGKPGRSGSQALQAHARRDDPDTLSIVSLPRLDRTTRNSEWANALAEAGVWIDVAGVARERLPDWLSERLARQGQSAPREALEFLADRVEGNLLAAHQELGKLRLLHPPGRLELEQIRAATLDVSRYDIGALPAAMLAGDAARVAKLVAGLQAEGEPLPLILWMVSEEIRGLLRLKRGPNRAVRMAAPPALVERALPRLDATLLADLLLRCAQLDRIFKGLVQGGRDSDPWLELADLALVLCTAVQGGLRAGAPAARPPLSRRDP